jgi:hypothetical protein
MLGTKLGFLAVLLLGLSAGGLYVLTSRGEPPGNGGSGTRDAEKTPTSQVEKGVGEERSPTTSHQNSVRSLKLKGFTAVSLTGAGKVVIKQTGKEAVSIRGDQELVEAAFAGVEDGTLVLTAVGGDGAAAGVEFVVDVKELRGLTVTGAARMEVKHVDTRELTVTVGGTGDLSVSGKADMLRLTVAGAGNFRGDGLATDRTTVEQGGLGKAVVNARKHLEVFILGSGSVEYVGSPEVSQTIVGEGTVTKKK